MSGGRGEEKLQSASAFQGQRVVMLIHRVELRTQAQVTYQAKAVAMADDLQIVTVNDIFHHSQVPADIRILMLGDDVGDILRIDQLHYLAHHHRKVGDGAGVDEDNVLFIDDQIGIAVQLGRLIVETNPIDFAGRSDGTVIVDFHALSIQRKLADSIMINRYFCNEIRVGFSFAQVTSTENSATGTPANASASSPSAD